MCKFKSADEPTFKSLSAAISKFVRDEAYRVSAYVPGHLAKSLANPAQNHQLSQKEKGKLDSLLNS